MDQQDSFLERGVIDSASVGPRDPHAKNERQSHTPNDFAVKECA